MTSRRCMKCMHELRAEETVCPVCGREYGTFQTEHFALKPGTILEGKYLVGEMLGQGGFGITYVGFDLLLEQKVAIKEYFPMSTGMVSRDNQTTVVWSTAMMQKTGTEKGFESFLKEARKMAKLRQIPSVVGVNSVFIQNETAYIVMDYVEGETLLKKLQREGRMDFPTCIRLLTPIMQALAQVHQHGIIHRDISPDNIMVKKDGSLVLLDLGAAKDLEIKDSSGNTQHSSQMVAKHGFSPYEQYMENGHIGSWTDVYAMAATIYYCCTCQVPPPATERMWEDRLSCQPLLTEPEFRILQKAMAVKSENRYQTMGELLTALTGTKDDSQEKRCQEEADRRRLEEERRRAEEARRHEEERQKEAEQNAEAERQQEQQRRLEKEHWEGQNHPKAAAMKFPKKWLLPVCAAVACLLVLVLFIVRENKSPGKEAEYTIAPTAAETEPTAEYTTAPATAETESNTIAPTAAETEPTVADLPVYAMRRAETYSELEAAGYAFDAFSSAPFWGQDIYKREQVQTVQFHNNLNQIPESAWDVSESQDHSVMAWMEDSALHVAANGKITCPDASFLFYCFSNLEAIDWGNCFDTSEITDMIDMFGSCISLTSLDLSSFDTSEVTDMRLMFYGCWSLTSLDLSGFNTSKVIHMGGMFLYCTSLNTLDLSSFNTSKVTNMSGMFDSCISLTSLNLSGFDTSKVTDMHEMFYECSGLTSLNLSGFNTSNVTNMSGMFYNCGSLTSLNLSNFDTSAVTEMDDMFTACDSLNELNCTDSKIQKAYKNR